MQLEVMKKLVVLSEEREYLIDAVFSIFKKYRVVLVTHDQTTIVSGDTLKTVFGRTTNQIADMMTMGMRERIKEIEQELDAHCIEYKQNIEENV